MRFKWSQWRRCIAFIAIVFGLFWLFFNTTHPPLPSPNRPLLFYSNQTRDDIKLVFGTAFKRAQHSIDIHIYSLTDSCIFKILNAQAKKGIPITIHYDPTASPQKPLKALNKQAPFVQLNPIVIKGLMHRKMLIIDQSMVFLGSANLTTASLRHHDNLVVGLYSPELAQFLNNPSSSPFEFFVEQTRGELWLLPDSAPDALKRLLLAIETASASIQIAMFTFTHPFLTEALISAKNRGVDIKVAVDHYTANGASKKAVDHLEQAGIPILVNQGAHLLHHKWALIDEKLLITGSANWTQAAFKKNQDFLLFLQADRPIAPLRTLWQHIALESFPRNLPTDKMKYIPLAL